MTHDYKQAREDFDSFMIGDVHVVNNLNDMVRAIESALTLAAKMQDGYVLVPRADLDLLRALSPFELVTGDSIWRTSPGSRQVVNQQDSWVVSQGVRSAHRARKNVENINAMIAAAETGDKE